MNLNFYNNNYDIHFIGFIGVDKIEQVYEPKEKYFSKEAKELIDKNWKDFVAKNQNAYDGDLFNFISLENYNDNIKLYYDYTKFSYTKTCRTKDYKKFTDTGNYTSNHISIPTIIKTIDNKILIGSDLTRVNGIQKWKFPGGIWEKCAPKIIDNINKEINEEIGNIELKNIKIICIATCKNATCITSFAEIGMNSKEFEKFIINNRKNAVDSYEMSEIKFIDLTKEGIENFLNDKSIALGSMGAISLYALMKNIDSL